MNRTFSLNNVSAVGLSPVQKSLLESSTQLQPQVVPLTKASLAAAEKQQQQQHQQQQQQQQQEFNMNPIESESLMRMTLLNSAGKLASKYASSNFLNSSDFATTTTLPTKTRTTAPRRRTPRNAQEFLQAAGVPDPEAYLTKGYYVGSMLNLSELAPTAPDTEMPGHHPHTNFMSQQYSQVAPVSSSSSSSTNGCFTNNNNNNKNQSLVKHSHDDSQLSNNLQRRTSVHEA